VLQETKQQALVSIDPYNTIVDRKPVFSAEEYKQKLLTLSGSQIIGNVTYRNFHFPLVAAERKNNVGKRLLLISGEHGDEPSGPIATLEFLKNQTDRKIHITSIPLLNPSGFFCNSHNNLEGVEVYASYGNPPSTQESIAVWNYLRNKHFDLALCLHEDSDTGETFANGFYIIQCPEATAISRKIIDKVRETTKITDAKRLWGNRGHDHGVVVWKPNYPTVYLAARLLKEKRIKTCLFSEPDAIQNREGKHEIPLKERIQIQKTVINTVVELLETDFDYMEKS